MTNPITAAIAPYAGLLKLAGFVLFVGLCVAAGVSWQKRGEEIRTLESQHGKDQAALGLYQQAQADWRRALASRKEQADREKRERQRIAKQAQEQAAKARAEKAEAEARADHWRRKWLDRTPDCDQALRAMAAACPALRDY